MTKQPESSGQSLPRQGSVLGRDLGSKLPPVLGAKGTSKPKTSLAQSSQSPAKPLASPDPKLRRRRTTLPRNASASDQLKKQSASLPASRSAKPKSTVELADQTKSQSRLSTPAPRARRRSGTVVEKQLDSKNQIGFLKSPIVDRQLLNDSSKHWGTDDELLESVESETFGKKFVTIPSFLVSTAVHLAIFLALALIAYHVELPAQRGVSLIAEFDTTPTPVKPTEDPATETIEIVEPLKDRSPLEMQADALSTDIKLSLIHI